MPGDLVATGQVPDIVLLDRKQKKIVLLKFTCPFDSFASSFKAAFDRKTERYERLALDLEELARNHMVLASVASMCGIRDLSVLRRTLGKISLVASHRIYLARASSEWTSGDFVKP